MSDSHHVSADDPATHEAGVNMKLIIGVGVVSLLAFAVCSVLAGVILNRLDERYDQAGGEPPARALVGKDEIGIVDYPPFDSDDRLARWKAEQRQRLEGYSWSDRKKNLIRVPIEQAMKEVVREAAGGARQ